MEAIKFKIVRGMNSSDKAKHKAFVRFLNIIFGLFIIYLLWNTVTL